MMESSSTFIVTRDRFKELFGLSGGLGGVLEDLPTEREKVLISWLIPGAIHHLAYALSMPCKRTQVVEIEIS